MPAPGDHIFMHSLSKSYWEGLRWIVTHQAKNGWTYQLFDHYAKADLYASEMAQFCPRITLLSQLLKFLNKAPITSLFNSIADINKLLPFYCIKGSGQHIDLASTLTTGNLCACYWLRSILPLTAACWYEITEIAVHPNNASKKENVKSIFKANDFHTVIPAFEKLANEKTPGRRHVLSAIVKSNYIEEKLPLYKCENGNIIQILDPSDIVELQQPIFVKYNPNRKMLQFYDGGIRRIYPWKMSERFSFTYFNPDPREITSIFQL